MTNISKQQEINHKSDSELTIGDRIQLKRKALNLSAEELVLLISLYDFPANSDNEKGISLPTIYRYEKGEREPATREIRLLCNALNVSADWLIFGESWNSEQEADTKLANNLRSLIQQASNTSITELLNKDKSRNDLHQLKVSEIKSRPKL